MVDLARDGLATTGQFGVLAVDNLKPAPAPLVLPAQLTLAASGDRRTHGRQS